MRRTTTTTNSHASGHVLGWVSLLTFAGLVAMGFAAALVHADEVARLQGTPPIENAGNDGASVIVSDEIDPCGPPPPDPKLAERLKDPAFRTRYEEYWESNRRDGVE